MTEFDTTRPFSSNGPWLNEMVPTADDFRSFDVKQAKALNGDDGGNYAPTSPIIIGGAGLALTSTAGATLQGGIETRQGGRLVLGNNDFPRLQPARSRTITWPLWEWTPDVTRGSTFLQDDYILMVLPPAQMGVQLKQSGFDLQVPVPSRYLHHGANLASVTLNYHLSSRPSSVPTLANRMVMAFGAIAADGVTFQTTTPTFNLIANSIGKWTGPGTSFAANSYTTFNANQSAFWFKATSVSGTHVTGGSEPTWPTTLGGTVTDNPGANQIVWTAQGYNGHLSAAQVANVDGYYAGGSNQQLKVTLDGTNLIDTTTYRYVLAVRLADMNAVFHSVQFAFNNITSLTFA